MGVVYELDNPETARWIRQEKDVFTAGFGGNAVVRDRATAVMVEFVPITHNPDALAENRRIERDSGLEEGELVYTRWIKLTQRRATGQKSAHLIARFKTNSAANSAIKEGW